MPSHSDAELRQRIAHREISKLAGDYGPAQLFPQLHTFGGMKFGYLPVRNWVIATAPLGEAVDIVGGCKHADGLHDDDGSGTIQL